MTPAERAAMASAGQIARVTLAAAWFAVLLWQGAGFTVASMTAALWYGIGGLFRPPDKPDG